MYGDTWFLSNDKSKRRRLSIFFLLQLDIALFDLTFVKEALTASMIQLRQFYIFGLKSKNANQNKWSSMY